MARATHRNDGVLGAPPRLYADSDAAADPPRRAPNRRGRGGRGRRAQAPDGAVTPQLPPPTGAPPPRYLATKSTPEKNDPLWTTGLAGAELQPMPNTEYISPGCEVLPTVVSVMHADMVSRSTGYSRRITEGMLAYYAAVLTWYRLLHLQQQNGSSLRQVEATFVEQVQSRSYEPPLLLASFLAGFGNTRVPSGRDVRFSLADRPAYLRAGRVRGWFGAVNGRTQTLYQNYPCLAVYAARLLASLEAGADHADPWWLPPQAIRPAIQGAIRPSAAMLGYGPIERLSAEKRDLLQRCGILPNDGFPSVNSDIPLSLDLMDAIQNELRQVPGLKLSPVPSILLGSQAQLALVRVVDEFDGLVEKTLVLESVYRLPDEVSFPASAFTYRVAHGLDSVPADTVAPWVVWRFDEDEPQPEWATLTAEGNALRRTEPQFLQLSEFRTTPYLVRARLEALERSFGAG